MARRGRRFGALADTKRDVRVVILEVLRSLKGQKIRMTGYAET
jgi:hypothetical protein